MDRIDIIIDLINHSVKDAKIEAREAKDFMRRVEDKVDNLTVRLALVEDRATKRSAFIAAVTGFLAGFLGK